MEQGSGFVTVNTINILSLGYGCLTIIFEKKVDALGDYLHAVDFIVIPMVTREATVPPPFRNLPEISSMSNTSVFGFTVNAVCRGSLLLKNRLLSDL